MIGGHKKAVSYVRWMDGTRLISASTDNQLKLWDINSGIVSGVQHDRRPINVLSGGDLPLQTLLPLLTILLESMLLGYSMAAGH